MAHYHGEFFFSVDVPAFPIQHIPGVRSPQPQLSSTSKRRRLSIPLVNDHIIELDSSEEESATRLHKSAASGAVRPLNVAPIVRPHHAAQNAARRTEQLTTLLPFPKANENREQCPYYNDRVYDIVMYCGPGYRQFPSALKLFHEMSDEQQVCREYDEKADAGFLHHPTSLTHGGISDPNTNGLAPGTATAVIGEAEVTICPIEEAFIVQVLEVLPDIDPEFVRRRYKWKREKYHFDGERISIYPDAEALLAELLDMPTYPKLSERLKSEAEPFFKETGRTITYDKSGRHERGYKQYVVALLAGHFSYIPTCAISKAVSEKGTAYDTFVFLDDADKNYHMTNEKWYRRSRVPRVDLEKKYRVDLQPPDPFMYANIVNEVQAAKQHIAREDVKAERARNNAAAEKHNLEECRRNGQLVECQVCFEGNVPLNRAVACYAEQAHWFCYDCINSQAETLVGSMKHELHCMDGSGCREAFPLASLRRAVSAKTLDRLLLNQQQAEIVAAGIEGLERCPHCDFSMICEDIDIDPYFSCQNPDCFRISCRKCNEPKHFPKTCEEARKDHALSFRHKVEEARSEAMIRICPKCGTQLIKEGGCNKMQCRCGAKLCYMCRKDLSNLNEAYSHFRGSGGGVTCQLHDGGPAHDQHATIDAIHDREALIAEEKAIQEAIAADHTLDDQTLRIESGKDRKTSSKESRTSAASTRYGLQLDGAVHDAPDEPAYGLHGERWNHRRVEMAHLMREPKRQQAIVAQQAQARAIQLAQQAAARHAEQTRWVAAMNAQIHRRLLDIDRSRQVAGTPSWPNDGQIVQFDNAPMRQAVPHHKMDPARAANAPMVAPRIANQHTLANTQVPYRAHQVATHGAHQAQQQVAGRVNQQYQQRQHHSGRQPHVVTRELERNLLFHPPAPTRDMWHEELNLDIDPEQVPLYENIWEDGAFHGMPGTFTHWTREHM